MRSPCGWRCSRTSPWETRRDGDDRLGGEAVMSVSKRARRAAQHERRRAEVELNLIPLIDIMSVMVSFLLVYSADVEAIQTSKGVEIPQSIAEVKARESVVVMITKDQLFV